MQNPLSLHADCKMIDWLNLFTWGKPEIAAIAYLAADLKKHTDLYVEVPAGILTLAVWPYKHQIIQASMSFPTCG